MADDQVLDVCAAVVEPGQAFQGHAEPLAVRCANQGEPAESKPQRPGEREGVARNLRWRLRRARAVGCRQHHVVTHDERREPFALDDLDEAQRQGPRQSGELAEALPAVHPVADRVRERLVPHPAAATALEVAGLGLCGRHQHAGAAERAARGERGEGRGVQPHPVPQLRAHAVDHEAGQP